MIDWLPIDLYEAVKAALGGTGWSILSDVTDHVTDIRFPVLTTVDVDQSASVFSSRDVHSRSSLSAGLTPSRTWMSDRKCWTFKRTNWCIINVTLKELPCSLSSVHLHLCPLFHACYIMCHYHKKLQMRKLTHGDFFGEKFFRNNLWASCVKITLSNHNVNHIVTKSVIKLGWLRGTCSGRTSVSDRRTLAVLRSTCGWRVITYVGKPSAVGQPTRPTQPFILSG